MDPHPHVLYGPCMAIRWGSTGGRMAAYACSLAPAAPAWHPPPGCRGPRSGVGIPAVTSTSTCLFFCCQLPSSLHFLTGTWLMLEARTSDQRRECIRRAVASKWQQATPYHRQTEPISWNFSYHSCQLMCLCILECALWARYVIVVGVLPRQTVCSGSGLQKTFGCAFLSPSSCTKPRYCEKKIKKKGRRNS